MSKFPKFFSESHDLEPHPTLKQKKGSIMFMIHYINQDFSQILTVDGNSVTGFGESSPIPTT